MNSFETTPLSGDEFDYEGKPDPLKWGYDIGGHGWENNELQYYTNDEKNAFAGTGILTIKAIKERVESNLFSSARVISEGKGDFIPYLTFIYY